MQPHDGLLLSCRFNGIAEMSITIERFPVFFKQVCLSPFFPLGFRLRDTDLPTWHKCCLSLSFQQMRHPAHFDECCLFTLQRDNKFYTAMSYCLPATAMRVPYSFMEATVWIVFTYFEVGLAANPGR